MSIYKNLIGYGPRAKHNGRYYSILGSGLSSNLEKGDKFDDEDYELGNYFLDEEVASRRAFVETVSRKIFQFSEYCAQTKPLDVTKPWYYVDCDPYGCFFKVASISSHKRNWQVSYFADEKDCIRAVKEIAEPMKNDYDKATSDWLEWKAKNEK